MNSKPNTWVTFWQTVIRFQKEKLNFWLAVRNTVGIVLPLIAGVELGVIPGGLAMATGALNVSFSDGQEPYPQRSRRMLSASALVGFAVFCGAISGHRNAAAVVVSAGWAFATGMLVALSTTAADLGAVSLVTLVVYMAVPQNVERAVYGGLLAMAGGLLQTALALAFWPLRKYVHERWTLADLFAELARMAETPIRATDAPPATRHATAAHVALASLVEDYSVEVERYRLLLSQAERMRLALMMLGRIRIRLERESASEVEMLDRYFRIGARALSTLAQCVRAGEPASADAESFAQLEQIAEKLRGQDPSRPPEIGAMLRDARFQMDALTGQLRSATELAGHASLEGFEEFERREASKPWRLRMGGTFATLRANLTLQSAACRHAIRLAVCVAIGTAVARGFELRRSYWAPMTIAIVLKPDFTATFSRGVLRLAGTLVGLVCATVLFHILSPSHFTEIGLIALSMFFLRYLGPANYGLLVIGVTALVVLLISMTGVAPQPVMAARGLNTAVGGAIALLAYWLWPTWERTQVGESIAKMLDAYRNSFHAIRLSYEYPKESFERQRDRARMPARLARSNVLASVDRLTAEPGTSPETVSALSEILATSHRLIHAIMALEAGLYTSSPAPARAAFQPFANDVELTLYYLASALRGSPVLRDSLPDLREAHHALIQSGDGHVERYALVNTETDRITNSLNTLSAALEKVAKK